MKDLWKKFEDIFWALIGGIILGFVIGKGIAYDSVITDCKVLGMTRFGDVPMGCRVGEKYQ